MSGYPDNLDVHPLTAWPGTLTPDLRRVRAPFSAPLGRTLSQLRVELRALECRRPILEVAIPPEQFRIDGRPYANARADHPGVVLSLPHTSVGPLRYATDRFYTWQDNLRAITLGLEALRKVERYGITRRGEQYQGFKALPAGSGDGASHLTRDEAVTLLQQVSGLGSDDEPKLIRAARAAAHPDRNAGGRALWDAVEAAAAVLAR